MNHEVERYVGELRQLRELAAVVKNQKEFIIQRINWLDSDIRMGIHTNWGKERMREMIEFLESLNKHAGVLLGEDFAFQANEVGSNPITRSNNMRP